MKFKHLLGAAFGAVRRAFSALMGEVVIKGRWDIVCRGPDGRIKWVDCYENIVVNAGLNYLLSAGLAGGVQDTSWFVGLTNGSPTVAAGDTLSSHAGWTEVSAYDESGRVAWVPGSVAGQSVSNAASPAVFTINTNGTTIGGAFLAGVASGTSGTLYAAAAFGVGNKTLDDNDTLSVTATFTAAAA